MSIIFIDDILFNDKGEERKIRFGNCILFLILNGLSILSGLFYLYFYFIIPYYQNSSNSLSLYLTIFYLITNIFYFLIFFELYILNPTELSITVKIITMFNPLIIFCIYYWNAILTHNLYVTYYNYIHNISKRIKFYKYLFFVVGIIFYIYILINIDYNDSQIISKNFSLMNNYNKSFIDIFNIFGLIIIIYIIIKLYYVLNKKEDFISISEYKESQENKKIKNIFTLVVTTNISFIIYFLFAFCPANIIMLLKNLFFYSNKNTYVIDFFTIFLISFSGIFTFCIRLLDPLRRHFIINLITFNREFISNYKELLLKEKALNESLTSNNVSDIYNCPEERSIDNLLNIKKISKNSKTIPMKTISFNFGKTKNNINENKNKKFGISTIILKKGSKSGKFEMGNFNESEQSNYEINSKNIESERIDTFSNLNDLEENYYLENQDDENNKKENETYNIKSQNQAEKKSISVNEKEKNDSQQEKDKNILYINSFESIDKSNNINNKKNISRFRNYTIVGQIPLNQVNEKKIHKFSFKNRFKRSLRKKREIINLFQRANSTQWDS